VTAPVAVEVRDAATVLMVRDGAQGLEVAMLRRRLESIFARGAYVFPGGALDEEDRDPRWGSRCDGHDDVSASAVLGTESGGLAFWVAAVRECFEESGILLAQGSSGRPVSFAAPADAERFRRHRATVDDSLVDLFDVCAAEDLQLPVGRLHYFSHWITPAPSPRRYDTRFFVTRAPDDQVLSHDDRETIAALWVRPADALDRNAAGDFELIYPTLRSLETLTSYPDADAVLAAATAAPLGLEPTT
jgi:8-oxo-dGTP pyrophosphatase MutT (NUDIX family)